MRIAALALAVIFASTIDCAIAGEKLNGMAYVTRFKDGDTFVARMDEGRTVTARLWGVDTPERNQPWGTEAHDALVALTTEPVTLECPNKDYRQRWVCRVRDKDGADINLALVAQGHAWWEKRYAKKAIQLRDAERDAREQRMGLWQADNPIPPWEWRRGRHN